MSVKERIRLMNQMAMQEKEAAPDERGRSPGGVSMASNTSASGSPRPLSKVRTSFVAIADKEGRIGLHRQPSGDSSFSERKLSGDTDAASSSILLDSSRSNVFSSSPDAFRSERTRGPSGSFSRSSLSNSGAGPTSAAPPAASPSSGPVPGTAGTVADPTPSTTSTIAGTGAEPKASGAATSSGPVPAPTGPIADSSLASGWGQKGLAASPQIRKAPRGEEAAGQRSGVGKSGQGVKESEAQPARDQGQAQAKGSENTLDRAGNKDRAAGGTAGGTAVAETTALNGVDKAKTTKPAPTSSTHTKTSGKAPESKGMTTPAAEKRPTEKKATPSHISPPFVKPRPKSPTQPVKLPERLTTHTGASAAKSKNAPPPVRPASRTSMGTSGKGLGRSASVAGRQHSSFGPPPKQAVDHPVLKKESKVDEGFLARMMRPTQAYANKVADKTQLPPKTPPRATPARKPASGKTGPAKRVVSRSTTASAAASPETSKSEQSSAVKQAAKKETPIAEEPISAKKVEKKNPVVKNILKEEQTKELPKAPEKKTEVTKPIETTIEPSKPVEKDNTVKVVETKTEVPEANEKQGNASESLDPKEEKPSEKEGSLEASEQKQLVSNTVEKPESTLKDSENGKKASDAMFEAFMNPGPEKVNAPQANGNHTKDEKTNGTSGKTGPEQSLSQTTTDDDAGASQQPTQLASSDTSNGIQTAPLAQNEEQEEW